MENGTLNSEAVRDPGDGKEDRSAAALNRMIAGGIVSQAVHAVAKLGIADLLAEGPMSGADLARATGAHPRSLRRVLRALAGAGVFREIEADRFALTPAAERLRTGVPGSLRHWAIMCGERWVWDVYGQLLHTVLTGETAFDHVHGAGSFEYLAGHPDAARVFDAAMADLAGQDHGEVAAACDVSDAATVVDVGGGQGFLMAAILQSFPGALGVLFDRSSVLADAPAFLDRAGVADRCRLEAGDFFASVPAGGDVYVLRNVLHDWDDDRARLILRNCRRAMPAHARLLLAERLVGAGPGGEGAWSDVVMMVFTGGLQRTRQEYESLLDESGFRLSRVVPTRAGRSVLEAVPA